MKNLLSFLLFACLFTACDNSETLKKTITISYEVQAKYRPDKRVALLDFSTTTKGKTVTIEGRTNLPEAKSELFQRLENEGLTVIDKLQLFPADTLKGKHFGIVTIPVCNIRSKAGDSQELATQALLGTPLQVLTLEKYFLVQTPDGYLGWLDSLEFQWMDKAQYDTWMNSEKVICLEDFAFVYEQPSENSPKISDLVAGSILQFVDNQGSYTHVRFPDGRTGFVPSSKLQPLQAWLDSRQPDAPNILASAREMMGRPYLWGGTSGKGMDCSGFTKMAFFINGILLPRDASQQCHVGKDVETDTVTWKNLEPGDLVFFGQKKAGDKKEKIRHVGIWLGDGKFINSSHKIYITSLVPGDPDFDEKRLKTFVRAKRIIGQEGKNGVVRLADTPFY